MSDPVARVRVVRADLARFPFDVVFLSTSGRFSGGAAASVVRALPLQAGGREDLPDGEALLQRARELARKGVPRNGFLRLELHPELPVVYAVNLVWTRAPEAEARGAKGLGAGEADAAARAGLVDALRHAVERERTHQRTRGGRRVFAMSSFGTGGLRQCLGRAACLLRSALDAARRGAPSWIEFVVVGTRVQSYDAALRVLGGLPWRCAEHGWEAPSQPPRHGLLHDQGRVLLDDDAEDGLWQKVLEVATSPDSFLFVGSGLSMNAKPPMPSWSKLLEKHLPELPSGNAIPGARLPEFAQIAADRSREQEVHRDLLNGVRGPSLPGLPHYQLLGLPWKAVFTTNYDTLVEDTLRILDLEPVVITHDEQLPELEGCAGVPVIKLHGGFCREGCDLEALHLEGVASDRRPGALPVATRDEYDEYFAQHPALGAYVEATLLTARGLVVGYSLSDHHLRALFTRIGRALRRKGHGDPWRLICLDFAAKAESDASVEQRELATYWRGRGVEWARLRGPRCGPEWSGAEQGAAFGARYEDFVDALATHSRFTLCERSLPPDLVTPEVWETLRERLGPGDPERLVRLVSALAGLGVTPDKKTLRALDPHGKARSLMKHYLTQEAYASLAHLKGYEKA